MSKIPPLDFTTAQHRLLSLAEPLGQEALPTADALGRVTATHVKARRSQPPADLSAMDGYAVCADDLDGPWRIVGESAAGHPFDGKLAPGEAVRISTGALMPDGSGAVLLQENATRDGDSLARNGEGDPTPRHIRRAGFDFREGDLLVAQSTHLDPAHIALAIGGGHGTLEVGVQPALAILDSGDELAEDPASAQRHQIPASNGAMLANMARPFVRDIARLGPVPDRLEAMLQAFDKAGSADVIVTSGGASVGDHDLVRPALEEWGAEIDFWKINMKPGKPLLVAKRGNQLIIGLPGNPVSSFVTAHLFLLPLLRHLAGDTGPLPATRDAELTHPLPASGSRTEFLRAEWSGGLVSVLGVQDSSALQSLARATALVMRSANAPEAAAGEVVTVYPLRNGGIA